MKYACIMNSFFNQPWAIMPSKLVEIEGVLRARSAGSRIMTMSDAAEEPTTQIVGKTAVVPVFGTILPRTGTMEMASGGVSAEALSAGIIKLARDPSIDRIVLAIDSPGGSVFGLPELAGRVAEVASRKPVIGIADALAASAGYWLLSQCTAAYVTPSGQVGSIGIVVPHVDISRMQEKAGVKTTYIASSDAKVGAAPELPLTDEVLADIRSKVDAYAEKFVAAVAHGRRTTPAIVKAQFGDGRMFLASDAVRLGMVDGVLKIEDVVHALTPVEATRRRTAVVARVADRANEVSRLVGL